MILLATSYFLRSMFYALFALCQLAWFTITVSTDLGQLSVHVCALLSCSVVMQLIILICYLNEWNDDDDDDANADTLYLICVLNGLFSATSSAD